MCKIRPLRVKFCRSPGRTLTPYGGEHLHIFKLRPSAHCRKLTVLTRVVYTVYWHDANSRAAVPPPAQSRPGAGSEVAAQENSASGPASPFTGPWRSTCPAAAFLLQRQKASLCAPGNSGGPHSSPSINPLSFTRRCGALEASRAWGTPREHCLWQSAEQSRCHTS